MVEESIKNTGQGNESAESTAKQLEEIVKASSKVADFLSEIALASKEQAQGIEQINNGLEQIDQVTQSNTANAEESASAAQELASQAQELKRMVGRFVLKETDGGGNGRERKETEAYIQSKIQDDTEQPLHTSEDAEKKTDGQTLINDKPEAEKGNVVPVVLGQREDEDTV
jgi:hypothetical protein